MRCFSHHDIAAIGICRTCGKGLCPACAREIDRGIVCSDACAESTRVSQEIVERAKRVYSIGARPKIPLATWYFGVIGVAAVLFAVVEWVQNASGGLIFLFASVGILFLSFAMFIWRRYGSVGLSL
jgi:hypothetical protein